MIKATLATVLTIGLVQAATAAPILVEDFTFRTIGTDGASGGGGLIFDQGGGDLAAELTFSPGAGQVQFANGTESLVTGDPDFAAVIGIQADITFIAAAGSTGNLTLFGEFGLFSGSFPFSQFDSEVISADSNFTGTVQLLFDSTAQTNFNDGLAIGSNSQAGIFITPDAGATGQIIADNIEFISAAEVPEPASLVLLGLGAVTMLGRRKARD